MVQSNTPLIYLYTDFGIQGPYLGQMEAAILNSCPGARVINLLADAPVTNPAYAAILLKALLAHAPLSDGLLAVVDPGVGSDRLPLVVESRGRLVAGPDNGLLAFLWEEDREAETWCIKKKGYALSNSFHGRDLFAPALARALIGDRDHLYPVEPSALVPSDARGDLWEIIYLDHYGNAFTGISGDSLMDNRLLLLGSKQISYAPSFHAMQPGRLYWYRNSCNLVEIASNRERADNQPEIFSGAKLSG